ncbi:MAG: cation:proton antiporter [Gammaproteobacteria bacterium]|nr:cation:proton antiporter [Gammaproteobacteria bacterium]
MSTPLLSILVFGFGLAFFFGYLAHQVKISPIVGYLIAGVLIGPSTPGYVADPNLTGELAEIGVILLMFGIGLHFSVADLNAVRKTVIPGAIIQILLTTALGFAFGLYQHWDVLSCFLFGLAISVASTVVLLRTLEDLKLLKTANGHMAVGWLVVEDMAMIGVLILLPPLAIMLGKYQPDLQNIAFLDKHLVLLFLFTLFKITTFIFTMFVFGRKLLPRLLHHIAKNSSNELFRLAILSVALAIAFIAAKLFDVSFALGAFFAGMILSESTLSHRAAEEILPLRDAFSVLFFVSVGMLLQPTTLITQPQLLLLTTLLIMLGKSCLAFIIVFSFRYPLSTACMIALSLAQIGEFSFILSTLGCKLHVLSTNVRDLIVAGAIISMILNPILFRFVVKCSPSLFKRT